MDSFSNNNGKKRPRPLNATQSVPGTTKTKKVLTPKEKRRAKYLGTINARKARWEKSRMSIVYPTDGPKVIFGLIWFGLIIAATYSGIFLDNEVFSTYAVAAVLGPIGALGAMQITLAWTRDKNNLVYLSAAGPLILAFGSFAVVRSHTAGLIALVAGLVVSVFLSFIGGSMPSGKMQFGQKSGAILKSLAISIPISSMVILSGLKFNIDVVSKPVSHNGASILLVLILLVSAYEAADYLVGSGSNNAFEGPVAGIISLWIVGFVLALVPPGGFGTMIMILLVVMTSICCPIGQIVGSMLLPKATAWAPALRRLDSYIIAAPLWLLLTFLLIS